MSAVLEHPLAQARLNRIMHSLVQGSGPWQAFRLEHHGASEAAAMLGLSLTTKRSELLRIKHSGLPREFSEWVQSHILDYGHQVEALARPHIEEMIGDDLYPVTYSLGKLSSSCDGLTLDGSIAMEHKQWSESLVALIRAGEVPDEHIPQCQQVMLCTGARRCLLVVSDGTPERMVSIWIDADPVWHQRLIDGWAQFDRDLAAYVPPSVVEPARAEPMDSLPAVSVRLDGALSVVGNLPTFADALKAFIARMPKKPATDTDFATCEAACKSLKKAEEALDAAESGALASITDVEAMRRAVADCRKLARDTRLAAEKLVERRKVEIKEHAVMAARRALDDHIATLNAELAPMRLLPVAADFPGAIKGLRSITSMQDALDTALANGKIAADAQGRQMRGNLAAFTAAANGLGALFPDLHALVHKAADDFRAVLDGRIAKHRADEAEKARRAAEDEAQRIAAAEQRAREQEAARIAAQQAEDARVAALAEQRRQDAAADSVRVAGLGKAETPVPGTLEAVQDAQESGFCAVAPAVYASSADDSATAAPSGDEVEGARADDSAPTAADPPHQPSAAQLLDEEQAKPGHDRDPYVETVLAKAAGLLPPTWTHSAFIALVMTAFDCKFPSHPKPSQEWWREVLAAGQALQQRGQ